MKVIFKDETNNVREEIQHDGVLDFLEHTIKDRSNRKTTEKVLHTSSARRARGLRSRSRGLTRPGVLQEL